MTYALPLFPALALLIGIFIERAAARPEDQPWVRAGYILHVAVLAISPLLALVAIRVHFRTTLAAGLWIIAAAAAAAIVFNAVIDRRDANRLVPRLIRMIAIFAIALIGLVGPLGASWMTARDLARALNESGTLPPSVTIVDERIGSLVFYLSPPLRAEATRSRLIQASLPEAISRARLDPPDAMVALRRTELERFNRMFATPPLSDRNAGTMVIFRSGAISAALARPR